MLLWRERELLAPVLLVRWRRGRGRSGRSEVVVAGEGEMGHVEPPKSRCVESCAGGASGEHQGQVSCFCSQPEKPSLLGQFWRLREGLQAWTRWAQRC